MTTINTLTPRWLRDLHRLLPIRAQFVLSGGIRDAVLADIGGRTTLVPQLRALWLQLQALGYTGLVVFDPVAGLRAYPEQPEVQEQLAQLLEFRPGPASLESLAVLMGKLVACREARLALVIDFASRLTRAPDHLAENEHPFFVASEKFSLTAAPIVPRSQIAAAQAAGSPLPPALFNPVIWLVNRPQDLPSWYSLDSERIASLPISLPDHTQREAAATVLASFFTGGDTASPETIARFTRQLATSSEGLTLSAVNDIARIAATRNIPLERVEDAVQAYKLGIVESPWQQSHLRERIANAATAIESRVKGQQGAVTKTLDILMRSVLGLSGAHTRSGGNRPRGVLFFAGPTGVGKTELAKALTELLFGDERAYLRFDMSEFAEEHASARLLGAPPGYVGYDAGGELTNAVRERPFAVILFDEIEKAHPRILDKFLQILEDGRLTDGRGDTAYFSEAVIVFTSNLGIYVEDEHGRRRQNVAPGDPSETVESRVREAIGDHFKYRLGRPEILNRIGDNIVVFDFIRPEVAAPILDSMLANITRNVSSQLGLTLQLAPPVRDALLELVCRDLSQGGRGIGNQLESLLINPLARALFQQAFPPGATITVTALQGDGALRSVALEHVNG